MKQVTLALLLSTLPCLAQDDTLLDLPVAHPSVEMRIVVRPAGVNGITQATLTPAGPTRVPVPLPAPANPPPTPPKPQVEEPRDLPPPTLYGEEIASENDTVYFVIDRSGSMGWRSVTFIGIDGQPRTDTMMERAKVELTRAILSLPANFRFNVVAYDCLATAWLPGMVLALDQNKQAAISWVSRLQPGNATGTGPATCLALFDRPNRLVALVTDGAPNCGVPAFSTYAVTGTYNELLCQEQHRAMIRANNTQGATINVFGIAATGSYRAFCQAVAADSGGSYTDLP